MESVLGRYRNLIVLVGVLFAQVLGLAVQVKRPSDSGSTHLIRIWAVGAVTPLEKALLWTQTSTRGLWHNYVYLRGVRAENRDLKAQIEQMRLEQTRLTQDAQQAHRLQALFNFKEQFISRTLAAQVIGGSGSDLSRVVYIDKGHSDGIRADMAVITEDGIVGKVLNADQATGHVARVLLIDDPTSGVGVILDKERLQGVLRGTPSGEVVLDKVMNDENVMVGEQVLTSGGDGIFPKGLPVGTVSKVSRGTETFLDIRVRPAVSLSRVEEVLVVTRIDERQAQPDQTGPVRAVDILAQRLPGVPPKPETASPAAPGTAASNSAGAATGASTPKPPKPQPQASVSPQAAAGTSAAAQNKLANQQTAAGASASQKKPLNPATPAGVAATSGAAGRATITPATTTPATAASGTGASGTATGAPPKPVKVATEPKPQPLPQPAVEDTPH